jgi:hypothetical protein
MLIICLKNVKNIKTRQNSVKKMKNEFLKSKFNNRKNSVLKKTDSTSKNKNI